MTRSQDYNRGDLVWWWSTQSGWENRSRALYVKDDGKKDVLLFIKIGDYKHVFRWPRDLIAPREKGEKGGTRLYARTKHRRLRHRSRG